MNREQLLVTEFRKKFAHPVHETPSLEGYNFELHSNLILEEAQEFVDACGLQTSLNEKGELRVVKALRRTAENHAEMVDALIDILYVTYGALSAMGVDSDPHFAEVHRTNMAKSIKKDANGKTVKGEGWTPPRIAYLLGLQKEGRLLGTGDNELDELRHKNRVLEQIRDENATAFARLRDELQAMTARLEKYDALERISRAARDPLTEV